ncbi:MULTISPECIES: YciI family protein [Kribbella]|uniref:YCII-related domain-containing protein n=1 Tax=Kribbella karoonensis TaxID=324851 RepID=A0ABP4PR09_9ACTN
MKFLLILQGAGDPRLPREVFERAAGDAGELVSGELLADPQLSVQLPAGEPSRIDGYYVIDVEDRDRAVELARLLPDARTGGRSVEIRALMHPAAVDL